jgi:hypothetical protein
MTQPQYKSVRILSEVYELISSAAKDSKLTISEFIASLCDGTGYINGRVFSTRNISNNGTIIYALDFDDNSVQMLHNYPDSNSDTPGTFYSGSFKFHNFTEALNYFKDLRQALPNREYKQPPNIFGGSGNLTTRNNYGFFQAIYNNINTNPEIAELICTYNVETLGRNSTFKYNTRESTIIYGSGPTRAKIPKDMIDAVRDKRNSLPIKKQDTPAEYQSLDYSTTLTPYVAALIRDGIV